MNKIEIKNTISEGKRIYTLNNKSKELLKEWTIRNEKGAITLFVLILMMFFLIILLISYSTRMNEINEQEKQLQQIQQEYNGQDEMEEKYYALQSL